MSKMKRNPSLFDPNNKPADLTALIARKWAKIVPLVLVTRTALYPRYEMTAAWEDGRAFQQFGRAADVPAWMAAHGYELVAPDTWEREP